jgi:hypothetical protein
VYRDEAGIKEVVANDCAANCLDPEIAKQFALVVCDIQSFARDAKSRQWDVVSCIDFMEHVPFERVPKIIEATANLSRCGAIYGISLLDDHEKLHCSVYPAYWWEERLRHYWPSVIRCEVTCNVPRQNRDVWGMWRCTKTMEERDAEDNNPEY